MKPADRVPEPPGPDLLNALKTRPPNGASKSAKAGAALAYYSIFSLGPLIVVVISIAALVFGREGVQGEVTSAIQGLLGKQGGEAVNTMLTAAGKPSEGIFATIVGTVTLVFAAIGVVVQLKEALNTVWEVEPKPGGGLWGFARSYVFALAGVLALGFLLLISMLLTAGLAAFGKSLGPYVPEFLLQAVGFVVSFGVIALLFPLMFKWLPDATVAWARRLAGRPRHRPAVRDRQVPDRLLHRQAGAGIDLRGVGLHRRGADLGLLLGADRAVRLGVHARAAPPARGR